jgi:hypothetical protein
MSLIVNGTEPGKIVYNGVELDRVIFNGVVVWESFDTSILQDFEYTRNDDGTYTIIDWKKTYNGEPSTRCIIPEHEKIIL